MKKRDGIWVKGLPLMISLFFLVSGFTTFAFAEEVVHIKVQNGFPKGDVSADTLWAFKEGAEKRSDGKLKVSVFAGGELVPGSDVFMATIRGTVDIAVTAPSMHAKGMPIASVEFGIPGAYVVKGDKTYQEKCEALRSFFNEGGFTDLLREEYAKKGIYYLGMHTYSENTVHSVKPYKTLDELQGKIFRTGGAMIEFANNVGLRATFIKPPETYLAFKMGTIDMGTFDTGAFTGLKWHEVAPYWVKGINDSLLAGGMYMNMKKWNSLSDDLKAALIGAEQDYFDALVQAYKKDYDAVDKLIAEGAVKVISVDAEAQAKFVESGLKLMETEAAKTPENAKAIALIQEWQKNQ
jgi:TRAP-type C4-dicarboxylate transport system substrate-binding protein